MHAGEAVQAWPSSICVRLTRACNARCDFCQAPHTDDSELSLSTLENIAIRLAAHGVRSVKLSGGEPTVRNDLPEIIRLFGDRQFVVTVITNGIRVTTKTLDALVAVSGKVKVSVHAPDQRNDLVLGNK